MTDRRIKIERLTLKAGNQMTFNFPDGSRIMVTVESIDRKGRSVTVINEAFQQLKD